MTVTKPLFNEFSLRARLSTRQAVLRPQFCSRPRPRAWVYAIGAGREYLYIGSTARLSERLRTHRSKQSWWTGAEYVMAWLTCCRRHAYEYESYQIATENPIFNEKRPSPDRPFIHDWSTLGSLILLRDEGEL